MVLVCEHAAHAMPARFGTLGLSDALATSHIAWDPGAAAVALQMSNRLSAVLVSGTVSRLIYDLNRPPNAPDAMPVRSEVHDIPQNSKLSAADKAARVAAIYDPFHARLGEVLAARDAPILVTVHSFTPVYHGSPRSTAIGILHDSDARLADAMLAHAPGDLGPVRRNDPYGPADGVMHTLQRHGSGRLNVMVEIRNDLIATPEAQSAMAARLSDWLITALAALGETVTEIA